MHQVAAVFQNCAVDNDVILTPTKFKQTKIKLMVSHNLVIYHQMYILTTEPYSVVISIISNLITYIH